MTSTVLASGSTEIDVAYSHFGLVLGSGEPGTVGPSADDTDDDTLFRVSGRQMLLFSAASSHMASLLVEFLDQPPDPPTADDGQDIVTGRAMDVVGPGPVVAYGIADGFTANLVETPFQGAAGLEVVCAGRRETLRRHMQGDLFFNGVERWTVRVWPATG